MTYGTGDCSVSVSGGGHDAYQNSVVFAQNIISGNALLSAVIRPGSVDVKILISGAQLRPTPHAAVPEVAV